MHIYLCVNVRNHDANKNDQYTIQKSLMNYTHKHTIFNIHSIHLKCIIMRVVFDIKHVT